MVTFTAMMKVAGLGEILSSERFGSTIESAHTHVVNELWVWQMADKFTMPRKWNTVSSMPSVG